MSQFLSTARTLLECPTAPYREHWMVGVLDAILAAIPGLQVRVDAYGNRVAALQRETHKAGPPIAIVAHTDHPGFVVESVSPDGRRVHARFEGGVQEKYFLGSPVRLFRSREDAGVPGRVVSAGPEVPGPLKHLPVVIECEQSATGAVLGMWDLVPFNVHEGLLHSRAVDDLIGCSICVEALRRAAASSDPKNMIGVFTRAEEVGFRGALCFAYDPASRALLPEDTRVISVETSSARPNTPIGGGAVIRVGDRTSLFDPDLMDAIRAAAETCSRETGTRDLRRALMDGGTCEATAFNASGWRAGGVCVPLGHYHNMNVEKGRIDAEYVAVQDCEDLIATLAELGRRGLGGSQQMDRLRVRFKELYETAAPLLR